MKRNKDEPLIHPKIMIPGWAGSLAPDEYEHLRKQLIHDPDFAFTWGFRRSTKRRSEDAIRRVAMWGDTDSRTANRELVAKAPSQALIPGDEVLVTDTNLVALGKRVTSTPPVEVTGVNPSWNGALAETALTGT